MKEVIAADSNWMDVYCEKEGLPSGYGGMIQPFLERIGSRILSLKGVAERPILVGLCGAQGSGKTTFTKFLSEWIAREAGVAIAGISLDDYYLSRAERRELASSVHPLFITRGVPGTHDVKLANNTIDSLLFSEPGTQLVLPSFDKYLDDVAPSDTWETRTGPLEIVLFEGWCVGARPQHPHELEEAVNSLEAEEDREGIWRKYVNKQLETTYARFFSRLDALIMFRVPSFSQVLEWRGLQQDKLAAAKGGTKQQNKSDADVGGLNLSRFIAHYERLTRHMLTTMPSYADCVIDVDQDHRFSEVTEDPGFGFL